MTPMISLSNRLLHRALIRELLMILLPSRKHYRGLIIQDHLLLSLFQAENGKIILDNSQQAVFEIGDKYVVAFCTKVQDGRNRSSERC